MSPLIFLAYELLMDPFNLLIKSDMTYVISHFDEDTKISLSY